MDQLRQSIGLRGYGQLNPLVEYQSDGFRMFEQMVGDIEYDVTRLCSTVRLIIGIITGFKESVSIMTCWRCGVTQFYLSLEDDLMLRFGSERIKHFYETMNIADDTVIIFTDTIFIDHRSDRKINDPI